MTDNIIQTTTSSIRILQITDPHLFADAEASLRGTVTQDSLQRVLDHVRDAGWAAHFIAMTGDVVQDDSREAYERFRGMFEPFGLPVHCVPGNHDVRPLMQEVLASEPFHYCASFEQNNWLIVCIDSCAEGSAAGEVSDDELERLSDLAASTQAEHVMIALHHPPILLGSRWLDEVGLMNGPQFLQRIVAVGKVRLCLFGHVHQAFDGAFDSIRIIGTPSTCRQFAVGSDSYAVDDNPPAYRRLALHEDGSIETRLVWVAETG